MIACLFHIGRSRPSARLDDGLILACILLIVGTYQESKMFDGTNIHPSKSGLSAGSSDLLPMHKASPIRRLFMGIRRRFKHVANFVS